MTQNIWVTGFSGSGKSTAGREAARLLGWRFVDSDEEIVRGARRPIHVIFQEEGEPRFRELERKALHKISQRDRQVVSTGGGIVVDERNRDRMRSTGTVVCLEATPETIHRRLLQERQNAGQPVVRPMLDHDDALGRITDLKSERQPSYALADRIVHTDELTTGQVAREIVRAYGAIVGHESAVANDVTKDLAATVQHADGHYPVWVGWGTVTELGERTQAMLAPRAAYVITDEGAHRVGRRAQVSLEAAGVPCHLFTMPSGERSKTLETAQHIYGWLIGLKAERGHLIVAVGGGVVGDLAGFVAATFLRGMPFAQAPTSLLAMMDASIGGKTAVDLPQGKNLVGAFHQPRFVLVDVQVLEGLPARELASGWSEAIKHGLILDEELLDRFESRRERILGLDREATTDVVRRSVSIKADVVSQDEKETLGVRTLLNYGHTIGHAIETVTGYERFLHGEAVSIGMMGAAIVSHGMDMLSLDEVDRQRRVLESYGLPVALADVDTESVFQATSVDKKTSRGKTNWVLLDRIGHAVTRSDVPEQLVLGALRELSR